jgi:uncharacterized protein (TIGR00251 family)
MYGEAVRVRVAAPPVDSAANKELVKFLSLTLGVTRGAVSIARGHSSRTKTVIIEGVTTENVLYRLLEDA